MCRRENSPGEIWSKRRHGNPLDIRNNLTHGQTYFSNALAGVAKKLHQCVLYFTNTISEDSEARRYHVHQDKQRRRVTKASLQASCVRKGCIATFEPLIQVKSEAVDTGRGFFSRAHAQISEDLVPSGHVV
jgi:hypothetical protein